MQKTKLSSSFELIKQSIYKKLTEINYFSEESFAFEFKEDRTIVTVMDLFISELVEETLKDLLPNSHFYSEEKKGDLKFPAIILDPIDGTKEFSRRIPESVVSLGVFNSPDLSDPKNEAWIFNPITGFEINSESINRAKAKTVYSKKIYSGTVSATEWSKGLFNELSTKENIQLMPLGSIAFKLGLLAAGASDFVISLQPKNIWDIAAGTLLCAQGGINFYHQGELVSRLNQEKYFPNLIWSNPNIYNGTLQNI